MPSNFPTRRNPITSASTSTSSNNNNNNLNLNSLEILIPSPSSFLTLTQSDNSHNDQVDQVSVEGERRVGREECVQGQELNLFSSNDIESTIRSSSINPNDINNSLSRLNLATGNNSIINSNSISDEFQQLSQFEEEEDISNTSTPVTLRDNNSISRRNHSLNLINSDEESNSSSTNDDGISSSTSGNNLASSSSSSSRTGGIFRDLNGLESVSGNNGRIKYRSNGKENWTNNENQPPVIQDSISTSPTINHPYNSFTEIPSEVSLPYHSMDEDDTNIPPPAPSTFSTLSTTFSTSPISVPQVERNTPTSRSTNSNALEQTNTDSRTRTSSIRGARSFFSNLLNRSSNQSLSSLSSGRSSPTPLLNPPRSPSPFTNSSSTFRPRSHSRASSLPGSPSLNSNYTENITSEVSTPSNTNTRPRPRPLSTIFSTLPTSLYTPSSAPLSRSSSLGAGVFNNPWPIPNILSQPPTPIYSTSPHRRNPLPKPTTDEFSKSTKLESLPKSIPTTLESIGLSVFALTQSISNSAALCGAILDNYILIGTTSGLDFLPIPLPGSLPMQNLGKKRRRDTRQPINLIKRTRFKQITILNERSNIMLAIAGKNDHVRVYALDTLRAMIELKMSGLDIRDGGYHIIPDPNLLLEKDLSFLSSPSPIPSSPTPSAIPTPTSTSNPISNSADSAAVEDPKGKRRADSPLLNTSPLLAGAFFSQPSTDTRIESTNGGLSSSFSSSSISTVRKVVSNSTSTNRHRSEFNSDLELEEEEEAGWRTTPEESSSVLDPIVASRRITVSELTRSQGRSDLAALLRSNDTVESKNLGEQDEEEEVLRQLRVAGRVSRSASLLENRGTSVDGGRKISRTKSAVDVPQPREATLRNVSSVKDDFLDFLNSGPPPSPPSTTTTTQESEENYRARTTNKKDTTKSSSRFINALNSLPSTLRYSAISPYSIPPIQYSSSTTNSPIHSNFNRNGPSSAPLVRENSNNLERFISPEARDASSLRYRQEARPTLLDLVDIIRGTGPSDSIESRSSTPELSRTSSSTLASKRASKRWTINGISSLLKPLPPPLNQNSSIDSNVFNSSNSRSNSPEPTQFTSLYRNRSISISAPEIQNQNRIIPPLPIIELPPLASVPLPPHDFKSTPEYNNGVDSDSVTPTLPASSQIPQLESTTPPSSSSSLEYVKLARTKGATLFRAVETNKRTYLAVLTGGGESDSDGGAKRVELFTGSKSISLSLNRTFVLPESPRTIEFQLLGDDLVDIYLVYNTSIFALEPYTVRVREVGVGRGERRTRRDRERRMQEIASESTATTTGTESIIEEELNPNLLTRHPADDTITSRPITPEPGSLNEGIDLRSPSPIPPLFDQSLTPTPNSIIDNPFDNIPSTSSSINQLEENEVAPPIPARISKPSLPYSTFQQMPFLPIFPSSILSSTWVIPPLYEDVINSNSTSSICTKTKHPDVTLPSNQNSPLPPAFDSHSFPLSLEPISLLGTTAQRNKSSPGLFFVTKSNKVSGIVTGDGRSVIRKPLVWNKPSSDPEIIEEAYEKIEILISTNSSSKHPKSSIIAIGKGEVKAIGVKGTVESEAPFSEAVLVSTPNSNRFNNDVSKEFKEIQFLGTHHSSSQLFYSELINGKWKVHCLIAK